MCRRWPSTCRLAWRKPRTPELERPAPAASWSSREEQKLRETGQHDFHSDVAPVLLEPPESLTLKPSGSFALKSDMTKNAGVCGSIEPFQAPTISTSPARSHKLPNRRNRWGSTQPMRIAEFVV